MKLVTFHSIDDEVRRIGVLASDGQSVTDLSAMAESLDARKGPDFTSMLDLLESGADWRDSLDSLVESAGNGQDEIRLDQIRLDPPLQPASIRDCMSFEQHLVGAMQTVVKWRSRPLAAVDRLMRKTLRRGLLKVPDVWYERPVYYKGNPRSVIGPEVDVIWPSYTEKLDFELEFGVVVGRAGRNIAKSEAAQHIAGYMLFDDFSARDIQLREMQGRLGPAKGKDFDTGNALGPYLVTADELADPYSLNISVFVNDELWCRCSTNEMYFTFEELIAYISQDETLYPGDFIGAGTLPGGCGLELDRWIQPGDVVELRSPELGTLRNRIKSQRHERAYRAV